VIELGFAIARKMNNMQTGSLSSGLSRKPQLSARANISCLEVTTRVQVGAVPHSSCKRAPSEAASISHLFVCCCAYDAMKKHTSYC
jgi:hypothetical protein